MNYETKKSIGNYSIGNSGLYNKVVSGLTGLALLTNSGCVDSINGVKLRPDSEYGKVKGVSPDGSKEDKKDEDAFYTSPWFWLGVGATGAAVGAGIAIGEHNDWGRKDRHREGVPSGGSGSGGGENGGGPGGQ